MNIYKRHRREENATTIKRDAREIKNNCKHTTMMVMLIGISEWELSQIIGNCMCRCGDGEEIELEIP